MHESATEINCKEYSLLHFWHCLDKPQMKSPQLSHHVGLLSWQSTNRWPRTLPCFTVAISICWLNGCHSKSLSYRLFSCENEPLFHFPGTRSWTTLLQLFSRLAWPLLNWCLITSKTASILFLLLLSEWLYISPIHFTAAINGLHHDECFSSQSRSYSL